MPHFEFELVLAEADKTGLFSTTFTYLAYSLHSVLEGENRVVLKHFLNSFFLLLL